MALKRLEDALIDGDAVRAVVRGSAINNDGASKMSYSAPSLEGQVRVVSEALGIAKFSPDTLDFIEGHGTGTLIGDKVEIAALNQVFAKVESTKFCALGSIKSNIGHLGTAAGIAGLIKAVLTLNHRFLPPIPFGDTPNEELRNGRLFLNPNSVQWPEHKVLRGGVSSFGIGGTNAHLVLEQGPVQKNTEGRGTERLTLSARTTKALAVMARRLTNHLETYRPALADVAYTLKVGRKQYPIRHEFIASSLEDAVSELKRLAEAPTRNRTQSLDVPEAPESLVGRRVSLPTYPFERQSYWITPNKNNQHSYQPSSPGLTLKTATNQDTYYVPVPMAEIHTSRSSIFGRK